jgi:hypothetical protein
MGQADRRGTFEQRKAKAIIKRKAMVKVTLKELETPDPVLSEEERQKQSHARIAMLSFAAMLNRSGMSVKEGKRRLKRYYKKGVKSEET